MPLVREWALFLEVGSCVCVPFRLSFEDLLLEMEIDPELSLLVAYVDLRVGKYPDGLPAAFDVTY